MKINRIETALYRLPPHRKIVDAVQEFDCMEVITANVITGDGSSGLGLSYTIGRGGKATKAFLDTEVVPLLLGEDPLETERLWEKVWWGLHWVGRHGVFSLAQSAADIALWDWKAKRAGLPLYQLLGAARRRVPIYSTDGGWLNHSQEQIVRESAEFVEQGFRGIKIKVGKDSRAEDVARLRAVRREIGDDVKLMVDANMRWTAAEAIARSRLFEEFDLFWFEEPIENDDITGHAQLRRSTRIPIAIGESLFNRYAFKEYLVHDAANILQPDVGRVGGVTEWLRIANLAHSFGVEVAPHFLMELHVQLSCAVPNALFVEYIPFLSPFLLEPLRIEDGYAYPPETAGHGIRFAEEKTRPHLVESSSWDAP